MASPLNENSEVEETLSSEEKRSKPMTDNTRLRQRRRRDPHSGTSGSELTATTGITLMSCIAELIYEGKMERVTWQQRGRVPWFYRPTGKPFGTIWEIIGFASAFLQCVVTTINYSFIYRHHDGPIKTSALPILFAFALLVSLQPSTILLFLYILTALSKHLLCQSSLFSLLLEIYGDHIFYPINPSEAEEMRFENVKKRN
ncbi:hypothetical protein QQP08_005842 [Theobroma cacao]|nr:hypothetical protein QQP08_005842 [Theobroma cacao]